MRGQPWIIKILLLSLALVAGPACIGHQPPLPESRHSQSALPGTGRPYELPTPPGMGGWARPTGQPGDLRILPWAGFRAALTVTFDDANSSQIDHYPELQALGVPMTFYLHTGSPGASSPIWAQAVRDGHELGNHTMRHAQTGRPADIDAATRFIEQTFGVHPWTMASPFGDASYPPLAATRFLVNRGVVNGLVGPDDNVDPFDLYCYGPPQDAPASAFIAEIESARRAGKWRIMLVHGFEGGSDGAYLPVKITEFIAAMKHAKALGDVWIDSMVNIASYWRGQRVLASARPNHSSAGTTWTWTLPANFPPQRNLRVRVEGGTLTQNGQPLPWNPHGYYTVSLDAGALTLAPDVPGTPASP